jgi:hypothetical protein
LASEPAWKIDEVKYLLLLPGILPQTTTCDQNVVYEIWEFFVMEINRVQFESTVKGVIFNNADPERPANTKLVERPVIFHCFIKWQHCFAYDN